MIRRLSPEDAAQMAALHKKGFHKGWPEADMAAHIEKDIVLGLGQLDGFIILSCAADQAEILTIVTDPNKQRQGLARQLLVASEETLRELGTDIIFLEVAEDNSPAIGLYKTCGYEPFGRRPAYYKRPDGRIAALTFRKALDDSQTAG